MNKKNIRRGEIYLADLDPIIGNEQGGIRPVFIIQNNKGNKHSGTTIAAPITTKRIPNRLIGKRSFSEYLQMKNIRVTRFCRKRM